MRVDEGDQVQFRCETNAPSDSIIEWTRPYGTMNPNATFGDGILKIPSVNQKDDSEYKCIVRTRSGTSEKSVQLHVKGNRKTIIHVIYY